MFGWLRHVLGGDPIAKLVEALGGKEPPSFDGVVMGALEALRDPNTPLAEVGARLEVDPGMSVRLLRVANSPAFATRHPVRTVPHAASLLGRSELESLLLAVAVKDVGPSHARSGFDLSTFWRLSAHRAAVGRALARRFEPSRRSDAFTVCLLSDMTVPLLLEAQGDRYVSVLEGWMEARGALDALEREAFGWDHAALGAALAAHWRFPEALAFSIGAHHQEASNEVDRVPRAVLACSVLHWSDMQDAEVAQHRLAERAAAIYGEPEEALLQVIQEGWSQGGALAAALG